MAGGSKRDRRSAAGDGDPHPTSLFPTAILVYILSLLPFPTALRCGSLSKAWLAACRELLALAAELDFGPDFAQDLTPERYAGAVGGALRLHAAETLRSLKISFHPGSSIPIRGVVQEWLNLAAAERVTVLELDMLVSPRSSSAMVISGQWLQWATLTCLSLSRCRLFPHFELVKLPPLRTLSLWEVDIEDDALAALLFHCPTLSAVKLTKCGLITTIHLISPLSLGYLAIIDCPKLAHVNISAPVLRSFHFWGALCSINLMDVPSLMDVCIISIKWWKLTDPGGFISFTVLQKSSVTALFLSNLVHVSTLTLCEVFLKIVSECPNPETLLFTFHNLKNLQLLVESTDVWGKGIENYIQFFCDFLQICSFPALENLFIEFVNVKPQRHICEHSVSALPIFFPIFPFSGPRFVSIRGFEGRTDQLQTARFFLERATNLETLVLVMAKRGELCLDAEIEAVCKSLDAIPKANHDVQMLLCRAADDPIGHPPPPHSEFYEEVLGYTSDELLKPGTR